MQPRPRLALRQAPASGRSLSERARSVPGNSAGHVVRAPRLGGCREEGRHVLGWGGFTWPRGLSIAGGPGPRRASWRARVGGSSAPPRREAKHLSPGRCRRSGGLQTPAPRPHGPLSTSGPQMPAPLGPGPGTRHPRRGGRVGGALAGSDLGEGTWASQSPAHRPGGTAHVSPRPRPPAPGHTPSCRLAPPAHPPTSAGTGAHCSPQAPRPAGFPASPARAV